MYTGTKVFPPSIELLLLVRLFATAPRFSRCLSQRRAVDGGMLILGKRTIVPTPSSGFRSSNASKNRIRVPLVHSCLLRVVRGVEGAILSCFG
jgi:hypothetical protein